MPSLSEARRRPGLPWPAAGLAWACGFDHRKYYATLPKMCKYPASLGAGLALIRS